MGIGYDGTGQALLLPCMYWLDSGNRQAIRMSLSRRRMNHELAKTLIITRNRSRDIAFVNVFQWSATSIAG
jgi:hypothetical protein